MEIVHATMNERRKNDCDRELFSELIEPLINPFLKHIVPPFLEECNPVYVFQLSGEVAWKWRMFHWLPRRVFESFQVLFSEAINDAFDRRLIKIYVSIVAFLIEERLALDYSGFRSKANEGLVNLRDTKISIFRLCEECF